DPAVPAGTLAVELPATAALAPTEKLFDAPVLPLPVAVIVKLPAFVIVTAWVSSSPAVKAAVVTGAPASAPFDVSTTVEVKPGTVLLNWSFARIRMLKLVPAVWPPIAASLVFVMAKWSNALADTAL